MRKYRKYRRCEGIVIDRRSNYNEKTVIGFFLGWGVDCCEDGNYSVALIELYSGKVVQVLPENITFLDKLSEQEEE